MTIKVLKTESNRDAEKLLRDALEILDEQSEYDASAVLLYSRKTGHLLMHASKDFDTISVTGAIETLKVRMIARGIGDE